MSQKSLYEFYVLYRDKDDTKVVVPPTQELATSADHARTLAIRAVDEEWDDKLENLEVHVNAV